MNTYHDDEDDDLLLQSAPCNPEPDWKEDFPDFQTWGLWVEAGWEGAPWSAGCWYRAGYSPEQANALSAQGLPAPGSLEALGRGIEYPEPRRS